MQVMDGKVSVVPKCPSAYASAQAFCFTLEACAASCGRVQELKVMLKRRACPLKHCSSPSHDSVARGIGPCPAMAQGRSHIRSHMRQGTMSCATESWLGSLIMSHMEDRAGRALTACHAQAPGAQTARACSSGMQWQVL